MKYVLGFDLFVEKENFCGELRKLFSVKVLKK